MSFITDGLTMMDQGLYKQKVFLDQEKPINKNDYYRDHYFVQGNDDERYIYTECFILDGEAKNVRTRYIQHVSEHHAMYKSLDSLVK